MRLILNTYLTPTYKKRKLSGGFFLSLPTISLFRHLMSNSSVMPVMVRKRSMGFKLIT